MRKAFTLVVLIAALAGPLVAQTYPRPASFSNPVRALADVDLYALAGLDNRALQLDARRRETATVGTPYVFAEAVGVELDLDNAGTWETLDDGSRIWRLRIRSADALNLSLALTRFELPANAELWVYDRSGDTVHGPYTAAHRHGEGGLYTPPVYGSEIVVELWVPAFAGEAHVAVGRVHHGFRLLYEKQGACNIDTVCPEGDLWQDLIRSVFWFVRSGTTLCTAQLVNTTANDFRPLALTARHCGVTETNAGSISAVFNYESPKCGQLAGGDLDHTLTGAQFRSRHPQSDTALFEFFDPIPAEFFPYFSGWDVSDTAPDGGVCVHHPNGDEKAITFSNTPLTQVTVPISDGTQVQTWEILWDLGTTEAGSSGSCVHDPESGLCVGVLTGGFASCAEPDRPDYFGRLAPGWEGGGTPETRLRDHLDPLDLGVTSWPGGEPGGGSACQPSSTTLCLRDRRFQVELDWGTALAHGPAGVVETGPESGTLWFFTPDNWEVVVKVLDGCDFNDHFWVFAGSATNVEYTLRVVDTATNMSQTYSNPLGRAAPAITDVTAFATCP